MTTALTSKDATTRASPRGRSVPVAVVLIGGVLLAVSTPVVATLVLGEQPYLALQRDDPGRAVSALVALARAAADLSAAATLGGLLTLLVLRPARGKDWQRLEEGFELRWTRAAGLAWMLSALALVPLDAADSSGVPLSRVLEPGALGFFIQASYLPKAWTFALLLLIVNYFCLTFARRWRDLLLPLALGTLASLAPLAIGQLLVGPNHDMGLDAGLVQAALLQPLLGALLLACALRATGRDVAARALRRLSRVALLVLPLAVAAEWVLLWFKALAPGEPGSATAILEIGRVATLTIMTVGTVWFALRTRRDGAARPVTSTLVVGTVLGLTAAAIGSVMLRIPPPQYFEPFDVAEILLGFSVAEAPTALTLLTAWRPNLFFALLATVAVVAYLLAVAVLRRRGDRWPAHRTALWCAGWAVVVLATSSGLGRYSGADFAVHMGVHMLLNMLAPILLVLAGPVTLLLRALPARRRQDPAGAREWLVSLLHWPLGRKLQHPIVVFVLFVGSYYALYFTPIFGEALRLHWAHQLMNLHFLITGALFYGLAIGVDRPARPLPHIAKLGMVLAAMPFHAFFAVIVMSSEDPIAERFYGYLDQPWMTDLLARQQLGGGIAWGGSELPLIVVILALGVQWRRADRNEARRLDRSSDQGRDDDFEAYNELLARLESRRAEPPEDRS